MGVQVPFSRTSQPGLLRKNEARFSPFLPKCENVTSDTFLFVHRKITDAFVSPNLNQNTRLYQTSLSCFWKNSCRGGEGNQTFQWEHLSLIDSITWSTNLEIDTPICLEWQINLFQVSEEEWNEFKKLGAHETNVKIPLLRFTRWNDRELRLSLRETGDVSVELRREQITETKQRLDRIFIFVFVEDGKQTQYWNSFPAHAGVQRPHSYAMKT